MVKQTFTLTVEVPSHDDAILVLIPRIIRERFTGTVVTVIECDAVNDPSDICGYCKVNIYPEPRTHSNGNMKYWQDETGLRGGTGCNGRGFHFHQPANP